MADIVEELTPGGSNDLTAKAPSLGPIVFVMGPPGSGKSTLCSRICEKFPGRFRHLSVGDYLRQLCNANELVALLSLQRSSQGSDHLSLEEIAKYIQESRLLPPAAIIPLIKAKLFNDNPSSGVCWLIDGFPRDLETALAFDEEIKAPTGLISLRCDAKIARERFLKRQRSTSDDGELFERRLKEYDEKLGEIVGYCSVKVSFQEHINSSKNDSDWINGVLNHLQEEYKDFVGLNESQNGQ